MKIWLKRIGIGLGALLLLVLIVGGGFVYFHVSSYDSSMAKVYDVPLPKVERSSDPALIARGEHLTHSIVPCAVSDCHGKDLAGGKLMDMGPLGVFAGPNVTSGGFLAVYSDAELARLLRYGIKKDGRSVTFMPSHEIEWLPDQELVAIVSYLRTVPAVQKPNGPLELGMLAKVLDRMDLLQLDIARLIDHEKAGRGPSPSPTKEYGALLARGCAGCHGKGFSGGPIPGAPPELPIPKNLTPHDTGLKGWSYEDFERAITQGIRKDGSKIDPFMPVEATSRCDETEKRALWSFFETLPATPFGER